MLESTRNSLRQDDQGVSPVIGTILMVAATVVLGATVIAAVNAFGGKDVDPPVNAVWKAQAIDSDGDGRSDVLKITYLTGPQGVNTADVQVNVVLTGGTLGTPTAAHATAGEWNPGDFWMYTGDGTYTVSVSMLGNTALDQTLVIDE